MSHALFNERFASYQQPAWHNLGIVFQDRISTEEAVRLARLDYGISKVPVVAQISPGKFVAIPDQFAVMRNPTDDDPEWRHFGTVGNDYDIIQNTELAAIVDQLVTGANWQLETVGALGHGETVFFVVKAEETQVAGEDVNLYFLITDKRDGTSSMQLAATPIRVVCQNTLSLAIRRVQAGIKIRHSSNMLLETSWRVEVIKQAHKAGESIVKALRELDKIRLNEEAFSDILTELFPLPPKPRSIDLKASGVLQLEEKAERAEYYHSWKSEQVTKAKVQVQTNYDRINDEYPAIAGTGWAAFNSVTEYLDHQRGKNDTTRSRDTLFGASAQVRDKAYSLILQQ